MRPRPRAGKRPYRIRTDHRPGWRRWLAISIVLGLLAVAPALSHAQGAGPDSVRLSWTAPGDDSLSGTAALYDLRMSDAPITLANWDAAAPVTGLPTPLPSGTTQSVMVRGVTSGNVYYFAIRTRDDAGNWSGLSNQVMWNGTLDTAPPSAPSGLAAAREGANVHLTWSPNAEPDLTGYAVYRATSSGGTYALLTPVPVPTPDFTDTAVPSGATTLWYAVTAVDGASNESARSAAASVTFEVAVSVSIEPCYPNPSHAIDAVRIPFTSSGGGTVTLDIVDAGGRRVRHLDLTALGTGSQEAVWDGTNDAGRAVAPGAYRAWLVVGDTRQSIRIVRVP